MTRPYPYRLSHWIVAGMIAVVGCAPRIPKEALQLTPESLERRQLQTRRFETDHYSDLLAAGVGVLQDLGFSLESSEDKLGLIVASRKQSAYNAGEIALSATLAVLGALAGSPTVMPVDKEQQVRASLVIRPAENGRESSVVRVTFQRVVWNTQGKVTKSELLTDAKVYQAFFDKLSKAVFLEAHEL